MDIKDYINYCAITGNFTWIKNTGNKNLIGKIAGSITPQGYKKICFKNKYYYCHRLAFLFMTGSFPKLIVDHIDANKFNNSWGNLRDASYQDNARYRGLNKNNTSGHTGVIFNKHINKWVAQVMINNKFKAIGRYDDKENAVIARNEFCKKEFGNFFYNLGE